MLGSILEIPMDANAWIHSVQRQSELFDVTSQLSRRCQVKCLKDSMIRVIMANAIEWTSNQWAFKDSKVAPNVFRLTDSVRGWVVGNSNSKNKKYLSSSLFSVSKPWKARAVARAAKTRWVSPEKNRMDLFIISRHLNLICWVSHEENRSLIFMWDLQLLLTFDHQKWHRVTTVKNLKSV